MFRPRMELRVMRNLSVSVMFNFGFRHRMELRAMRNLTVSVMFISIERLLAVLNVVIAGKRRDRWAEFDCSSLRERNNRDRLSFEMRFELGRESALRINARLFAALRSRFYYVCAVRY